MVETTRKDIKPASEALQVKNDATTEEQLPPTVTTSDIPSSNIEEPLTIITPDISSDNNVKPQEGSNGTNEDRFTPPITQLQTFPKLEADIISHDTAEQVQLNDVRANIINGKARNDEHETDYHYDVSNGIIVTNSVENLENETSSPDMQLENPVLDIEDNKNILDEKSKGSVEYDASEESDANSNYMNEQIDASEQTKMKNNKYNSYEDVDNDVDKDVDKGASVASAVDITYTSPENVEFSTEQRLNDYNDDINNGSEEENTEQGADIHEEQQFGKPTDNVASEFENESKEITAADDPAGIIMSTDDTLEETHQSNRNDSSEIFADENQPEHILEDGKINQASENEESFIDTTNIGSDILSDEESQEHHIDDSSDHLQKEAVQAQLEQNDTTEIHRQMEDDFDAHNLNFSQPSQGDKNDQEKTIGSYETTNIIESSLSDHEQPTVVEHAHHLIEEELPHNSLNNASLQFSDVQTDSAESFSKDEHVPKHVSHKHVVIQENADILHSHNSEGNEEGDINEKDERSDVGLDEEKSSTIDASEEFQFHGGEQQLDEDQYQIERDASLKSVGTLNTSLQPDMSQGSHQRSLTPYSATLLNSETDDRDNESDFPRSVSAASERGEATTTDKKHGMSPTGVSHEEHQIESNEIKYSPEFKNTILTAFDCQNVNPTLQDIFQLPEKNNSDMENVIDGSGSFRPPEIHSAESERNVVDIKEVKSSGYHDTDFEPFAAESFNIETTANELNQSSDANTVALQEEQKNSIPIVVQFASEDVASDKSSDDDKGHTGDSTDEKGFESDDERDDPVKRNERRKITPPHDECRFVEDVGTPPSTPSTENTENAVEHENLESKFYEYEQSVPPLSNVVREIFSNNSFEKADEIKKDSIIIVKNEQILCADHRSADDLVSGNGYEYDGSIFLLNMVSKTNKGLEESEDDVLELNDQYDAKRMEMDKDDSNKNAQQFEGSTKDVEIHFPTENDAIASEANDSNQGEISQSLYDKLGAVANEFVDRVFNSVEQKDAIEEIVQEIQKLNISSDIGNRYDEHDHKKTKVEQSGSSMNSKEIEHSLDGSSEDVSFEHSESSIREVAETNVDNGHINHSNIEKNHDTEQDIARHVEDILMGATDLSSQTADRKESYVSPNLFGQHVEEEEQLVLTPYLHSQNETSLHRLQNQTDLTEELHIGIPEYESHNESSFVVKDVSDSNCSSLSSNEADKQTAREITDYIYSKNQFQMHKVEHENFVQAGNSDEEV